MGPGRYNTESDEIAARREQVWELRVAGNSVRKIAKLIGVSVGTVHGDLEAARQETADSTKNSVEKYRDLELARLDEWIAEAHKRLPRAKDGAASLLINSLRSLSERRAKLLGLDAPAEVVTSNTNENVEATPERARRLMAEKFGRVSIGAGANLDTVDSSEPTEPTG